MSFMYDILKISGICPIMVAPEPDAAVPAARALVNGGVPVCEVLMRNEQSLGNMAKIAREVPEIVIGAGSVLNVEMAAEVIDNGAQFCVLPGFSPKVVEYCLKKDIAVLPGCVTATEIMMALEYGIDVLKFYPVYQLGGVEMLQQLNNGPFGRVRWVVTGGLNSENFLPLLKHPNTLACGGDWMFADYNALDEKNYEQITTNTRHSVYKVLDQRAAMNK